MKQLSISIMALAVFVGAVFYAHTVSAHESPALMTSQHIERIRENCTQAQSTLTRLHASDGLMRVNRGQIYESISTRLMAPLNSRIALNRLDGVKLLEISQDYNQNLELFREQYQIYEQAMSRTLRINCTAQPVTFYDSVADTREKRSILHGITEDMSDNIQNYRTEFERFADALEGEE